ncbi:hypothetical protein COO91_08520 [Nostoc flagelliforme CCNUN1]|uniref:Uncharacterized protein n=1 Tax=Nostoc flagelliforme CCNUN1 TaxID=2038116 RepID=A0A2K8T3W2_9NOSO|nr:hypothetical protein COO91_08520 [Nostoc flagelliforme CCNUN1]
MPTSKLRVVSSALKLSILTKILPDRFLAGLFSDDKLGFVASLANLDK